MNYRFRLEADLGELTERFGVTRVLFYYESSREKGPTESIAAIRSHGRERTLDEFRWGLMPFWARDAIQADTLSVLRNKSFDYLLKRQRCVIPCNAYYRVWPDDPKRRPEHVLYRQRDALAMAGLYDVWSSPQGYEMRTCTILSVRSSEPDRDEYVPMLLGPEQVEAWLAPEFMDKPDIEMMVESIAESQKWLIRRLLEDPASAESDGDAAMATTLSRP